MEFSTVSLKSVKWLLAIGGLITWQIASISPSHAETNNDRVSLFAGEDSSSPITRSSARLSAGANNFNPALKLPPPRLENLPNPIPSPTPPAKLAPLANSDANSGSGKNSAQPSNNTSPGANPGSLAILEGLQPDLHSDWNNSGQVNRTIENTAIFRLNNGDRVLVKTGYDTYQQPGAKTATNIPLQFNWETKINSLKVQPGVGIDFLDRSTTPNFNLKVDYPLATGLTVSGDIQQGAYKFNAQTIENQISALRYGPSLFWTIDPNTSLFSSLHFGNYSDSNAETQFFSRIERKFGEFSVAANLFTWSYQNPTDKGYFAPSDFMVYTAEVAWEGDVIANLLKCGLSASLGGQQVNGSTSDAGGYQTKCTAKFSPNFEADLGYSFSNVKNQATGLSTANSQSLGTQIRIKF